jgi:hypothetical protein
MKRALLVIALVAPLASNEARAENKGAPAAKPAFRPYVFNLMRERGNFESSPVPGRPGWRTVGFWSMRTPRVGDLT